MKTPIEALSSFKNIILKKYGENPGTMLVHTGAIGWVLSSLAQITALMFNPEIKPEQKMFLVPQEIGDAIVNIISFYTLTHGVKCIGSKLTSTGKIKTAKLGELLKRDGHILEKGQEKVVGKKYVGDWDFDITKLPNYKTELLSEYKPFNNGAEVIAGLTGSIISGNLVTPVIRNYYASKRQKDMIVRYNNYKNNHPIKEPSISQKNITFDNFTKNASAYPYSGSLRI